MPVLQPLIAFLPFLALVWVAGRSRAERHEDALAALTHLGFGLAKGLLLAVPLERVVQWSQHAAPQAASQWLSAMGLLSLTCQLFLAFSALADISQGLAGLRGWRLPDWGSHPFWAGSWRDLWGRFCLPLAERLSATRQALAGLMLVLLTVLLWRGPTLALLLFGGVHGLWIVVEAKLGGSWLGRRLPLPVRAVLTSGVFFLSSGLLSGSSLSDVWEQWQRLVSPPAATLYSVLLDARLTMPWLVWLLWLSLLTTVAAPKLSTLLTRHRRWSLGSGIVLGGLAVFLTGSGIALPVLGAWRAAAQAVWVLGFREGNAEVHVGRDGWLLAQTELDRLTLREQTARLPQDLPLRIQALHKAAAIKPFTLVVIVPDKLSLYPEVLLPADYAGPVQPPGHARKLEQLRAEGVEVLDVAPLLWALRDRQPVYFQHDRHWTPEAMKAVALEVERFIRQKHPELASQITPVVDARLLERTAVGDLAQALSGTWAEALWGEESAQLIAIHGLPPSATSPYLVLGDAWLRVFDDPTLSFGNAAGEAQSAGFVAQLSALLGRSLAVAESSTPSAELEQQVRDKKLVLWLLRSSQL